MIIPNRSDLDNYTRFLSSAVTAHSAQEEPMNSRPDEGFQISNSLPYLSYLLRYCEVIFGVSKDISRIVSDPESDIGKQECALMFFISSILHADICIFSPYINDIENLLSVGFYSSKADVRIICIDLVGSLINHTSPFLTSASPWVLRCCETNINVSQEWMFSLMHVILSTTNDIDMTVRLLDLSFILVGKNPLSSFDEMHCHFVAHMEMESPVH